MTTATQKIGKITSLAVVLALISGLTAYAQEFLRPEVAFRYAAVVAGNTIEVDWAIEDGYYLYKKKLSFASNSSAIVLGDYVLPEGLPHEDEFFGAQKVYRDRFFVSIPYTVVGDRPDKLELQVKSQGCADLGICYPPQTWTSDIPLAGLATTVASTANSNSGNKLSLANRFGASDDFLAADEAFKPYAEALDGSTVEISFQIAPGYYLYKDKLAADSKSDEIQLGRIDLPPGKVKTDPYFGDSEVYYGDVFGKVGLARATPEPLDFPIDVHYQGCAEDGICYPPLTRTLYVSLPAATTVAALPPAGQSGVAAPVTEQAKLAQVITGSSMLVVIGVFFVAGLLLAFTPCVLPMVPILSGIIAGEGDNVSSSRGFTLALSYVLGMALVYTAAGVAAAAAGLQLQAAFNQPWVLILFSSLFVALALGMFGLFEFQMPSAIQSRMSAISGSQKSGTMIGAFVMGALSSLIVTACVAPALIAALTVIAQTGDLLRGGGALFAMSLGMGVPLLAVGAAQGKLLPKAGPWMVAVKSAFGFMMLGLAIWMMSRVLPDTLTLALWGVLIFMAGVYLGGLTTLTPESLGMQKLGKGFGLLAVLYGAVLVTGSLTGGDSMTRPLASLNYAGQTGVAEHDGLAFRRVKTVADLDQALLVAAADGKPAMLDFYADWCVSCKEMEAYTFTDANVQAALANTVLLQADVTANDAEDQELLQRFGVFGPPTIIFFGADGRQREGYEVVGYMKAAAFVEHIRLSIKSNITLTAQTTGPDR